MINFLRARKENKMSDLINMDKIENVLRKIERLEEDVFLPIIGRKKGAFLESLIRKYQPKMILEIGSLVGYSAILMARNLRKGKIISVEFVSEIANAARKHIKEAGFSDVINVIEGNAIDTIPTLEVVFDFVFIDASKEEYFSYLKLLERYRKIVRGCVILADNVKIFVDSMKDYLEYVRKSEKYKSKYYDFGDDGMELSIMV